LSITTAELLAPSSIAIVGISRDPQKYANRCLDKLQHYGFSGPIYPVSASVERVGDLKCYRSLASIGESVDHVALAVPAPLVAGVLRECPTTGTRFATVFSSGFREAGGDEGVGREDELLAAARAAGVRIIGPNCNGFLNVFDHVALTTTNTVVRAGELDIRPGGIGIISQSGGLGQVNVLYRCLQMGLPVGFEVSGGNDADIDSLELATAMIEDDRIEVILMVIEGMRDAARLERLAVAAAAADKPIVALKLGRSAAGRQAIASHTGAIGGPDEIYDGVFDELGIIRVEDTHELVDAAGVLLSGRASRGGGVAAVAVSGGNAAMFADRAGAAELSMATLGDQTVDSIRSLLPGYANISNPVDLTATALHTYEDVLSCLIEDDNVDSVVPIITLDRSEHIANIINVARGGSKPVSLLWTGGCVDQPELSREDVSRRGAYVFQNASECVAALKRRQWWLERRAPVAAREEIPAEPATGLAEAGTELVVGNAAFAWAEQIGLSVPIGRVVADRAAALQAAEELGYPVVLKVEQEDLVHKSESGGVAVDLRDSAALGAACDAMTASFPGARMLVQQMIVDGSEGVIGFIRDPVFGPVVMFGAGGVELELRRDVAFRLATCGVDEVRRALEALPSFPALRGWRGKGPYDVAAFARAVVTVARAGLRDPWITEIDLNPVMIGVNSVRVVDAFVRYASTESA